MRASNAARRVKGLSSGNLARKTTIGVGGDGAWPDTRWEGIRRRAAAAGMDRGQGSDLSE